MEELARETVYQVQYTVDGQAWLVHSSYKSDTDAFTEASWLAEQTLGVRVVERTIIDTVVGF